MRRTVVALALLLASCTDGAAPRPRPTALPTTTVTPSPSPSATPTGAADGDVDGDGRRDRVALVPKPGSLERGVRVTYATGRTETLWSGFAVTLLGVLDMDLDGDGEIVVHTDTRWGYLWSRVATRVHGRLQWLRHEFRDVAEFATGRDWAGDDTNGWGCRERHPLPGRELYWVEVNARTARASIAYFTITGDSLVRVGSARVEDTTPDEAGPEYALGIRCGSLRRKHKDY